MICVGMRLMKYMKFQKSINIKGGVIKFIIAGLYAVTVTAEALLALSGGIAAGGLTAVALKYACDADRNDKNKDRYYKKGFESERRRQEQELKRAESRNNHNLNNIKNKRDCIIGK